MKTLHVKVNNVNGLTSRLAAELVAEANKHKSNITLVVDPNNTQEQADLKSIMNVFTISIPSGMEFDIKFDGADEAEAMESFSHLIAELPL
ncbi:MAG: HPr family phosphocarrier protein [Bacilli bacterium]|nr:HPr family phosphocarrier protein [Bacilli bacterium]